MRGIYGAVFVAGAALLVCCSAESHRENELSGDGSGKRYDVNEYKQLAEYEEFLRFLEEYDRIQDRNGLHGIGGSLVGRNLNGIGGSSLLGRSLGGNRNLNGLGGSSLLGRNLNGLGGSSLVGRNLNGIGGSSLLGREAENERSIKNDAAGHKNRILHPMFDATGADTPRSSYSVLKMLDYISRAKEAGKYPMSPYESSLYGGLNDDFSKRNFDEIDRSNLDTFVSKRNMDEIDRSNMPFPYAIKRFYHLYGSNYLDLDTPVSSFDKKRYRPDYPMDEIDLSHFPIGSKRSLVSFPLARNIQ